MAEWLGRRTCNPEVPGSSPPSCHSLDLFSVAPSSTPWLRSVNSQLDCLLPVGMLCYVYLKYLFLHTAPQASSFKHKACIHEVALLFTLLFYRDCFKKQSVARSFECSHDKSFTQTNMLCLLHNKTRSVVAFV